MDKIKQCPHCFTFIEMIEINCAIFRCGIYKDTGMQIPPHLSKEACDALGDQIWGCGKPFKFNTKTNNLEKCDYI